MPYGCTVKFSQSEKIILHDSVVYIKPALLALEPERDRETERERGRDKERKRERERFFD